MAASIANWATEVAMKDKTADMKALQKAKKIEKNLENMGWRWVKLSDRMSVFVPCDKDGNPTKLGLEKIKRQKLLHGIT